jgi:hypothetical protein
MALASWMRAMLPTGLGWATGLGGILSAIPEIALVPEGKTLGCAA